LLDRDPDQHAKQVRQDVFRAIADLGKWAFSTDPLALWAVQLCTNRNCPATSVGRDTNAARNMAKRAIKGMRGETVYLHVWGSVLRRAQPKADPVDAVRHAAAVEAGTYPVGYAWTRCSPTLWEPRPRPVRDATGAAVGVAGGVPSAAGREAPGATGQARGTTAAPASGDFATSIVSLDNQGHRRSSGLIMGHRPIAKNR